MSSRFVYQHHDAPCLHLITTALFWFATVWRLGSASYQPNALIDEWYLRTSGLSTWMRLSVTRDSQIDSLNALNLPQFLTANNTARHIMDFQYILLTLYLTQPLSQRFQWGSKTTYNANPYGRISTTGITPRYDFVIKRGSKTLEGVHESAIVINTQRPGPIEANWGDTMQITVTNRITGPEEGGILY